MKLLIGLAFAVLLAATTPAAAQDGDGARRLELAERYIELSIGDNISKSVAAMIDSEIASDTAMGEDERRWMRANMPDLMMGMIEHMAADLAPIYAETYSIEELEALVEFFSSPVGQTIARKQFELGTRVDEIVAGAIVAMFEQFVEKYCKEFDCDVAGAAKL